MDAIIHEAAGSQLKEACRRLNEYEPGDAKITGTFGIKGINGMKMISIIKLFSLKKSIFCVSN